MDTMRGTLADLGGSSLDEEDDADHEAPPPEIGSDERRMQVRAYNFWASLLEDRNFPSVEDLDPRAPDFGPHGVLLDFSKGVDDPLVSFLGDKLALECGANGMQIGRLSDIPTRSLLSRITDHYMQILANQAPIGFEAEFVNQRGMTILYRGILLPFSSDDETIDFIYGVINWKELAESRAADELLLEIDQSLDRSADRARGRSNEMLADWADGPGAQAHHHSEVGDTAAQLLEPAFGDATGEDPAEDEDEGVNSAGTGLADLLASARKLATAARESEDRSRAALYKAIGRAYDVSLAAAQEPEEFAALMEDAGLSVQDRAPMTPVVKLVFGADYDKTRLTEYACALSHAHRLGLEAGRLGCFLAEAEGGLKGVVHAERQLRREETGAPAEQQVGPRSAIARKLRALQPRGFLDIGSEGSEFALIMVRRTETGEVVVLGEVPENVPLVEKAARSLVG